MNRAVFSIRFGQIRRKVFLPKAPKSPEYPEYKEKAPPLPQAGIKDR